MRASDVCPANQPGVSGMDAARAISEEDGWDSFLRTDLFYINIHVSYGIM